MVLGVPYLIGVPDGDTLGVGVGGGGVGVIGGGVGVTVGGGGGGGGGGVGFEEVLTKTTGFEFAF